MRACNNLPQPRCRVGLRKISHSSSQCLLGSTVFGVIPTSFFFIIHHHHKVFSCDKYKHDISPAKLEQYIHRIALKGYNQSTRRTTNYHIHIYTKHESSVVDFCVVDANGGSLVRFEQVVTSSGEGGGGGGRNRRGGGVTVEKRVHTMYSRKTTLRLGKFWGGL